MRVHLARVDAVLVQAVIAAALSFAHLHDVASAAGQHGWKAWAYPVSVDLLLVAAWRRLRSGGVKASGWCWFLVALTASLGANVATAGVLDLGSVPAWLRILVAGWPAVAFLGGTLLAHTARDSTGDPAPVTPEPTATAPEPEPRPVIALGTPLDPDTYDYEAAVLWNAHAGALWRRFSIYLRREVAKRAGLTQRAFRDHARISFAKVAEYQKRGAVHFHAVIRLDGPEGGDTTPPAWATAELLTDAIQAAATAARIDGPEIDGRAHRFVFGRQLDVRPIRSADFDNGQELTERAVAAYIAKYATKGAETATGTLDRPIRFLAELAQARITDHARQMIRTAWTLGARPELADLRLRAWAHMLGFRGHFSTKSRRYSTTLGALRDARANWRRAQATPPVPQDPDHLPAVRRNLGRHAGSRPQHSGLDGVTAPATRLPVPRVASARILPTWPYP